MSSPLVPSAGVEADAAGHLAGYRPSVSRPRPVASDLLAADPGPWAARSCNIAFNEEIGHFDYCTRMTVPTGTCNGGLEGAPGDQEPTVADDTARFREPTSLLVKVSGGNATSAPGFDGTSDLADRPDGNTRLHPTPELFSSPLTGSGFGVNYTSAAFESDTPRIEAPDLAPPLTTTSPAGAGGSSGTTFPA